MSSTTQSVAVAVSGSGLSMIVIVVAPWMKMGSEQDADLPARGLEAVVDQHATPADAPRHVRGAPRQQLVLVHADVAVQRTPAHARHVEDAAAEQVVGPLPHAHIGDLAARARARALR